MERLSYIWAEIGDWYMSRFDEPIFQMLQGFILGAMLIGAIWLAKSLMTKEDNDDQRTGD